MNLVESKPLYCIYGSFYFPVNSDHLPCRCWRKAQHDATNTLFHSENDMFRVLAFFTHSTLGETIKVHFWTLSVHHLNLFIIINNNNKETHIHVYIFFHFHFTSILYCTLNTSKSVLYHDRMWKKQYKILYKALWISQKPRKDFPSVMEK